MQDNESQNVRALARGTFTNLNGVAVRSILMFLISLLAARLFGAELYGAYAIGIAAVSILSTFGRLGLARTVTRFVALYRARNEPGLVIGTLRLALRLSIPMSVGIALALAIWSVPLANLFGESLLVSSYFLVFALSVPMLALGTILAAFTDGLKLMRYRVTALDVVRPSGELLGLIMLYWFGARRYGLPVAYMCSVTFSTGLLIYYATGQLQRLAKAAANTASISPVTPLRPLLSFAAPVFAIEVLIITSQRVGVLMLGALGTSEMVGVYSILAQVVGIGLIIVMAVNSMFGPMVTELVERQKTDELSYLYKVSTRWMLAVTMPFFLVLGFFRAEILSVFGQAFVDGSVVLWFMIVAALFTISVGVCGIILMMSGHPQYSVLNEGVMLTTVVGLSLLFIPRYGLQGAVWASITGSFLVDILRVSQVWWNLRIHPYSWALLKVAVAGVAMTVVLFSWEEYVLQGVRVWYLVIMGGGIALLTYVVALITLGLDVTELELLRSLQRQIRRLGLLSGQ